MACRAALLQVPGTVQLAEIEFHPPHTSEPPAFRAGKLRLLLTAGPAAPPPITTWTVAATRHLLLSPTPAWTVPQGTHVQLRAIAPPRVPTSLPLRAPRVPAPPAQRLRALPACVPFGDVPILEAHEVPGRFPACQRWTDGSVQDVLCGAAFVYQDDTGQWQPFEFHLPDGLTIDVCEVFALHEAVLSVPLDEPAAVIFSDSAAALQGLLKYSRLPHAYRFKEQGPLFHNIIQRIAEGQTHFIFAKVKAHDPTEVDGVLLSAGNHAADTAAKDGALSNDAPVELPGHDDQAVFGVWTFRPNDLDPLGDGHWDRAQARSLRRRLYVAGLESFVRREAARTLKDARDLATRAVMNGPVWVRSLNVHFNDVVSTWWYQVRAYGLNYWFGGSNLCPFCRAAGEVDRARLAIRPTHFGICHHQSYGQATSRCTMLSLR